MNTGEEEVGCPGLWSCQVSIEMRMRAQGIESCILQSQARLLQQSNPTLILWLKADFISISGTSDHSRSPGLSFRWSFRGGGKGLLSSVFHDRALFPSESWRLRSRHIFTCYIEGKESTGRKHCPCFKGLACRGRTSLRLTLMFLFNH